MATSNRVFVSPGVYTSEKDLTFVAQSVGVTTLGMVGETLKGPAFEPVLIKNYDDFRTYFGTTSPLKDSNGNPSYELPYFAKSYLQESNQLFVTRILGLTGYLPVTTYGIVTLGAPIFDSTIVPVEVTGLALIPTDTGITASAVYPGLSGKTATTGDSIPVFLTGGTYLDGQWFTIGLVPVSATSGLTVSSEITGPIGDVTNFGWYNPFFDDVTDTVTAYLFVYDLTGLTFNVSTYTYNGITGKTSDNLVLAALRSRGSYVVSTLHLQTTTGITLTGDAILTDPLGEFTITVTTDGTSGETRTFVCSLDSTSSKFISKVLGTGAFEKNEEQYPLYVFEVYSKLATALKDRGLIRGLNLTAITHSVGTDFLTTWQTAASPYVVSEVRGGVVADLFRVIAVSDGDASNVQVKVSIINIDLETAEFDILVRDFNDTDENLVVLERFSRCSMNKDVPGYVALKVGTSDTEYELRSKYIMLEMADNFPTDAIPAGFRGFTADQLNSVGYLGGVMYKTQYYNAGDAVTYSWDGVAEDFSGDKIRRVMLGLSTQIGYDNSLFKYKGANAGTTTPGFHLSSQAAAITGSTITGFEFDATPYDLEGQTGTDVTNKLLTVANRKFTFALMGGFDGWDVYRQIRTFGDQYKFGKATYDDNNTDNGGCFDPLVGNSDYYAYLAGIETFANAEAVDINVFATPGINFYDHSSLTEEAIDMVEEDRADSIYIISSKNRTTADEVIDDLDIVDLDSNYSATYWPWIQVRDNENSTQLFIPPTGEVLRNIALTDNVSYPWFAVAGYSRGLVNAIKAYKKLTLDERDDLYRMRINPIATFSDTGPIIWGNKTLQIRESALDRINVRRLLLRARKLIAAVAVRLLFEQNDEQVRAEFARLVNPILEAIKKERGLYDFRLVVSNDPEDIDSNTLRGKIYIKPTRALEFIDIEFIITPTGASFENI